MKRTVSDFALNLGMLMGIMSNLEEQGIKPPTIPQAEWDELKLIALKVAGRFYEKSETKKRSEKNG